MQTFPRRTPSASAETDASDPASDVVDGLLVRALLAVGGEPVGLIDFLPATERAGEGVSAST